MTTRGEKHYSNHGPICPHCEYAPGSTELYDEDLCNLRCEACDKDYRVSVYVSWSWTTWKEGEEP
jgi:hypothetical protein